MLRAAYSLALWNRGVAIPSFMLQGWLGFEIWVLPGVGGFLMDGCGEFIVEICCCQKNGIGYIFFQLYHEF